MLKEPQKSLMAQWLRQHLRDIKCAVHDLEVMGLNPGHVELVVHSTSAYVAL